MTAKDLKDDAYVARRSADIGRTHSMDQWSRMRDAIEADSMFRALPFNRRQALREAIDSARERIIAAAVTP